MINFSPLLLANQANQIKDEVAQFFADVADKGVSAEDYRRLHNIYERPMRKLHAHSLYTYRKLAENKISFAKTITIDKFSNLSRRLLQTA